MLGLACVVVVLSTCRAESLTGNETAEGDTEGKEEWTVNRKQLAVYYGQVFNTVTLPDIVPIAMNARCNEVANTA